MFEQKLQRTSTLIVEICTTIPSISISEGVYILEILHKMLFTFWEDFSFILNRASRNYKYISQYFEH